MYTHSAAARDRQLIRSGFSMLPIHLALMVQSMDHCYHRNDSHEHIEYPYNNIR